MSYLIHLSADEVRYESPIQNQESSCQFDLTTDLFNTNSTVEVQPSKYIFQLYHNDRQMGYCYSITYGLDVIQNLIASKVQADQKYQVEVSQDHLTVKLFQLVSGYIYGEKSTLLDTFQLSKLPKLEVIQTFTDSESESDLEVVESETESELEIPEPAPKDLIGEELSLSRSSSSKSDPTESNSDSSESSSDDSESDSDSDSDSSDSDSSDSDYEYSETENSSEDSSSQ